ncbi:hypothetical protein MSG28_010681 [Choristoneura fumiferana]|uniref:Uncharacterized protein n=1 Tax=Choristoneura fumiferana TaxID=7141 RepID=A0ACC0KNK1_CHOFU|nr:hypothetical protein MSG28_010681 [Choristoneura fumiferana]
MVVREWFTRRAESATVSPGTERGARGPYGGARVVHEARGERDGLAGHVRAAVQRHAHATAPPPPPPYMSAARVARMVVREWFTRRAESATVSPGTYAPRSSATRHATAPPPPPPLQYTSVSAARVARMVVREWFTRRAESATVSPGTYAPRSSATRHATAPPPPPPTVYLSERGARGPYGGARVVHEARGERDGLAGHVRAAVQRHAARHRAAAHAAHPQTVLHAALELLLQTKTGKNMVNSQHRWFQIQINRVHHNEHLLILMREPVGLPEGCFAVVLDPSVGPEEGGRQAHREPQLEGETMDAGSINTFPDRNCPGKYSSDVLSKTIRNLSSFRGILMTLHTSEDNYL